MNFIKCEQLNKPSALTSEPIGQFLHCTINNATLLGEPFIYQVLQWTQPLGRIKLRDLKRAFVRLHLISAHDALVLLRASYSASRFIYTSHEFIKCAGHTLLSDIDNSLRLTLSNIINVNIRNEQWRQASLPVKAGGIGVRSVMSIALSVFLSSSTALIYYKPAPK